MKIIKQFVIGNIQNNTFILEHNGKIILIDAPHPANRVIDFLNEEKLVIDYIFITHAHYDHIQGLNDISDVFPKAKIFIAPKEIRFLRSPKENLSFRHEEDVIFNKLVHSFDDLDLDGVTTKYISGHSKQSTVILFDGHAFSGDTLFRLNIGRSDLPNGDGVRLIKEIKEVFFSLPGSTIVYPGHGFKTTVQNEIDNNQALK